MGKRGPQKKSNLKREANGRVSRDRTTQAKARDRELANASVEEWEAMETALKARWRVHDVPMSQVRDQMAGSYIGRLCLAHELSKDDAIGITRTQYDAAMNYLAEREAYHIAINAPKQMGAVDLNRVQGQSHGENVKRTLQAVDRFKATELAIQSAQTQLGNRGNLYAAMNLCVVSEIELSHMVGDVRIALNALVRHYGLESRRAA